MLVGKPRQRPGQRLEVVDDAQAGKPEALCQLGPPETPCAIGERDVLALDGSRDSQGGGLRPGPRRLEIARKRGLDIRHRVVFDDADAFRLAMEIG